MKKSRILRQHDDTPRTILSLANKKTINLDIGNLCTLECPKCARQTQFKGIRPVPGHMMTVQDFTKIADHFTRISCCGQISDPIFNLSLIHI